MRVLVEQVRDAAVKWLQNLELLAGTISSASGASGYRPGWCGVEGGVPVFTLMGGEEATEWEAFPEREALLVGTQDMLLSRALNRGYAAYPPWWPIYFGLLNVDALWVMDEVQLMGVGRTTSVQLQHFYDPRKAQDLPRRTLWMSATLGAEKPSGARGRYELAPPKWMVTPELEEAQVNRITAADCWTDEDRRALSSVLDAPKRIIDKTADPAWVFKSDSLIDAVLSSAQTQSDHHRLVLVILNQVPRARLVYERLVEVAQQNSSNRPEIVLLHSRFRPRDRRKKLKSLTTPLPQNGRIVVSTQVLEAGVDLDADALFTEVCPWPSLVQRLGRLNRRGEKDGVATVIPVPVESAQGNKKKSKRKKDLSKTEQEALDRARDKAARPYRWQDLEDCISRVRKLNGNASIAAIAMLDPYPLEREGPVLRKFHVEDLFDTDPDLSGGVIDVSRFVRAIDRDVDVNVFWRSIRDDVEAQPPPHRDEICSVPVYELTKLGSDVRGWLLSLQRGGRRKAAWREVRLLDRVVRPGDTIMLDIETRGYDSRMGWIGEDGRNARPDTWVAAVDGRRAWVRRRDDESIEIIEELDHRVEGYAARDEDPRSAAKRWMTLADHLQKAGECAATLAESLVPNLAASIEMAARWHDLGKALERVHDGNVTRPFQALLHRAGTLEEGHPAENEIYAKSNRRGGQWPAGTRFRHEVASTLAWLSDPDADDLVAWLIMAHHGKVRMLPEPWDDERMDDAAGVRKGDRIPREAMALVGRECPFELDPELLLPARDHSSWQGRAAALLRDYGAFFLAYIEALVRIGDWRGSS